MAKTERQWVETAPRKTVGATERAMTERSWLPLMRRQQLKTWRLAQASGHHEQRCGCDAEHKDEKRICAPRKPGIRNRSYRAGPGHNSDSRSRNPDNSCDLPRPKLRPEQSLTERTPSSRRPQLRPVIAYISVNNLLLGNLLTKLSFPWSVPFRGAWRAALDTDFPDRRKN
jgi:hypothetical protein